MTGGPIGAVGALTRDVANGTYEPVGGAAVRYPLRNLYNKIASLNSGTARVKWLTLGDSYAQKVLLQVAPVLQTMYGGAAGGYFSGSVTGSVTTNATTGTVTDNLADFTLWPTGLTSTFAASSTRTYGTGGSTAVCDTIKVFHLNTGGTFKIQVDGVDNTTPTVTSDNSLGITTISVSRAAHNVTIVQLTGTPKIVGVGFEDSTVSGLVPINISQSGIALSSATAQAWTNLGTLLANVAPDVMTLEAKESSTDFAASLATIFALTAAQAPTMDVIGIGTPPVATNDADQVLQNAQLKAACATAGYTYYDTYALFGSYAKLTALGWNGDGTHVDVKADQYRGMLMLRDLGLFASFGRGWQQRAVLPSVAFQRAQDTASVGVLKSDPTFGLDLQLWLTRYFSIKDSTGATERCRLSGTADVTDFVPQKIRIGSTSNVCLNGDSATLLSVRRGDSTGNTGDISVRSLVATPATLSNQSGTVTLDLSTGSVFLVNLTGSVTSWAFSNAASSGQDIEVHFIQDATGSRTLAGANASIKLAGGALTLTTTASKRDVLRFRQLSGGYYESARSMNVG